MSALVSIGTNFAVHFAARRDLRGDYTVHYATDEAMAMAMVQRHRPEAVLLQLDPRARYTNNGVLLGRIHSACSPTAAIIVVSSQKATAKRTEKVKWTARDGNARGFVPFAALPKLGQLVFEILRLMREQAGELQS